MIEAAQGDCQARGQIAARPIDNRAADRPHDGLRGSRGFGGDTRLGGRGGRSRLSSGPSRGRGGRHRRRRRRGHVEGQRVQVGGQRPDVTFDQLSAKGRHGRGHALGHGAVQADASHLRHEFLIGEIGLGVGLSVRAVTGDALLGEEARTALELSGRGAQGVDVGEHVPAFLSGQAGEGRHVTICTALRDDGEPGRRRGLAGDVGQADGCHRHRQTRGLRTVPKPILPVTCGALGLVNSLSARRVRRGERVGWAEGRRGRRRDVIGWRGDILGQGEAASRQNNTHEKHDCGKANFHYFPS